MVSSDLIIVRGAGDIGTGTIHRLRMAGYNLFALETHAPAAIRRSVSFSEAVYDGTAEVEGLTAERIMAAEQAWEVIRRGNIPLLVDPAGESIRSLKPFAVIDAIIAKKNTGMRMDMAPLTVGLGPGFTAGLDVHYAIETMRGHDLGRIIKKGSPLPDTGKPGLISGYGEERVVHAAAGGIFHAEKKIGDSVTAGERIGHILNGTEQIPVTAGLTGILRGILRDGHPVTAGFKTADIDPRPGERQNCFTISDKARCIAGSVLELVSFYSRTHGSCL